jgi:hypothetical protein
VTDKGILAGLRDAAMRHPDVTEGAACVGTVLESRTLKIGKSAFLFLRSGEGRLKLEASLDEANRLQRLDPGHYTVGSGGWVKFVWTDDGGPDPRLLERWIAESYHLIAGPRRRRGS